MVSALVLDLILALLFFIPVVWAIKKGFFVSVLQLGAWVLSILLAGVLSSALAAPLYEAFAAEPARRMIESSIDSAVSGSEVIQSAQTVIAELPEAVTQLAERFAGITPDSLIAGLDANQFTAANAAQLLESSIVAPIGTAVFRAVLSLIFFLLLMVVTKLILRQVAKLRKLPVLKQADKLLGAALGVIKGVLLLFVLALLLQAAAALSLGGTEFAQAVEDSAITNLFTMHLQ